MLETIRDYALEQLEAAGEADVLRRRHAGYFLALGETANLTAESEGPPRAEIVRAEQDNFRAAIDWALDSDPEALRVPPHDRSGAVLGDNDPFEGVRRLQSVLEHGSRVPQVLRARALRVYAESAYIAGDFDTSERVQDESLREFRELGNEPGIAIALHRISVGATAAGDLARARELLDECLAICRRRPNAKLVADALVKLAWIEQLEGNPERALEPWRKALHDAKRSGSRGCKRAQPGLLPPRQTSWGAPSSPGSGHATLSASARSATTGR